MKIKYKKKFKQSRVKKVIQIIGSQILPLSSINTFKNY